MVTKEESKFWADLHATLGLVWVSTRHEDVFSEGVPDVSYGLNQVNGWLELKVGKRPAKPASRVPLDHLTPAQRLWLFKRDISGGHTFLFLKVIGAQMEDAYYLIPGRRLLHDFVKPNEDTISEMAVFSDGWINQIDLIKALTKDYK